MFLLFLPLSSTYDKNEENLTAGPERPVHTFLLLLPVLPPVDTFAPREFHPVSRQQMYQPVGMSLMIYISLQPQPCLQIPLISYS